MDYYRKNGLKPLVATAEAMLKADVRDKKESNFASDLHGEIAETVLECSIYDCLHSLGWSPGDYRVEKSLILKDVESKNENYFTELDLVLFTPYRVVAFESKSYQGNKTLSGKGLLKSKSGKVDVFKQHTQHMNVLIGNFDSFRLKIDTGLPPYSMFIFDFSLGELKDDRSSSYKAMLPVVHYYDMDVIIRGMCKNKKIWNMKLLNRALDIITKNEDEQRRKHLEYVKGLKRDGNR